jgi:hypothetical protein
MEYGQVRQASNGSVLSPDDARGNSRDGWAIGVLHRARLAAASLDPRERRNRRQRRDQYRRSPGPRVIRADGRCRNDESRL